MTALLLLGFACRLLDYRRYRRSPPQRGPMTGQELLWPTCSVRFGTAPPIDSNRSAVAYQSTCPASSCIYSYSRVFQIRS